MACYSVPESDFIYEIVCIYTKYCAYFVMTSTYMPWIYDRLTMKRMKERIHFTKETTTKKNMKWKSLLAFQPFGFYFIWCSCDQHMIYMLIAMLFSLTRQLIHWILNDQKSDNKKSSKATSVKYHLRAYAHSD